MAVVAVAEERSFTRAAAKLGVQQPQVSERIKKLEQRLGMALFVRSTRRVELTLAGERFLPLAQDVVGAAEAARNFVASAGDEHHTLKLGMIEAVVGAPLRQAIVNRFLERWTQHDLEISVADSVSNYERLTAGELDVALCMTSPGFSRSGLQTKVLQQKVAMLVLPADHPLSRFSEIPVTELAGLDVLLAPGTDCPDLVNSLKRQMERLHMRPHRGPEAARGTLIRLARRMGFAALWWREELPGQSPSPDYDASPIEAMVARSIESQPFGLELSVVYNPFRKSPGVDHFLSTAGHFASRRVSTPTQRHQAA
jgi:DNA-binding transcriptional LysR family regulator